MRRNIKIDVVLDTESGGVKEFGINIDGSGREWIVLEGFNDSISVNELTEEIGNRLADLFELD